MQETWVPSLGGEDPWRRKWLPTPVILPGESHGQRSLIGYSPKGHKKSESKSVGLRIFCLELGGTLSMYTHMKLY